jgi:hypothetical protein
MLLVIEMNLLSKSFCSLAMTYCHYVALRMHFRAVVLASVKDNKFLTVMPCAEKS